MLNKKQREELNKEAEELFKELDNLDLSNPKKDKKIVSLSGRRCGESINRIMHEAADMLDAYLKKCGL